MPEQTLTGFEPTGAPAAAGAGRDRRRWWALGVLVLVQFMLVLDITVVNVALPTIQRDLHFSHAGLTWVIDGYVLTAGGLLLLGGRLGDLLGRRRMFIAGVLVFTFASALSGAAQSSTMLVASRFLQGAGEALASPAAFGLIALLFTDTAERLQAIGLFGAIAGVAGAAGPILSGLILHSVSWRWIFFINLPIGAFAILAVSRLVDESRAQGATRKGRPDVLGAVLMTAGLSGIVYGFIQAANHPWGAAGTVVPVATGVLLLAAFAALEARITNPLLPLRFFSNRTRVTANVVTLFYASGLFAMFYVLTLYFQQVEHANALSTGLRYLPFGVGIIFGIAIASLLVPRVGVKPLLAACVGLVAVGMALLSRITVGGDYWTEAFPGLLVMALASGGVFSGLGNAAVHGVSTQDAGLASGVQNASQQVGGAIGLAVLATIALRHTTHLAHTGVNLPHALTSGYALAFRVGAIVLAVGALMVLILFERVIPEPEETPYGM